MTVPAQRLLILAGVTLLPSGFLAAAAPELTPQIAAAVSAVFFVVCFDFLLSRKRLRKLQVILPDLLRLVKDREAEFDVHLLREGDAPGDVRVGLVIPPAIGAEEEAQTFLAPGSARFRLPWHAHPVQRGSYNIAQALLETSSAAGLWSIRERKQVQSEIRVYPNLLADRKAAAALLLNRPQSGVHALRQVGKGREFEKLREYIPGDTYDDIHWRATARHGKPITKVYQVERTQEVYVVLDASRLSGRTAGFEPVLEHYLSASLLLGLAVEKAGDLFGVIAFDDRVQRMIRAATGRTHFGACRDALYTLTTKRVAPDFRELSNFLRTRLRRRALLIVLTDLDDAVIAEEFERNVALVRRHHLVLANMLRPAGTAPLFSASDVQTTDDIFDRLGGHLRWRKLQETQRRLQTIGVPLALLHADRLASELVAQYRNVKRRQLL
jgi:uncharacterized protein (DUF58 family)